MIVLPTKFWQYLTVAVVAVVLLWTFLGAIGSGKAKAKAQAILETKEQIIKSLDYFFSDQDRYPTAEEFADRNIMGRYMSSFPAAEYPSKNCSQTFLYKRPESSGYQFYFCLPAKHDGWGKGWNQVNK